MGMETEMEMETGMAMETEMGTCRRFRQLPPAVRAIQVMWTPRPVSEKGLSGIATVGVLISGTGRYTDPQLDWLARKVSL